MSFSVCDWRFTPEWAYVSAVGRVEQLNSRTVSTRIALFSPCRKNISLSIYPKSCSYPASRPTEGALRDRHGRRVRDAMGVSGRSASLLARTNDPDATVKSRGSGIPVLMPAQCADSALSQRDDAKGITRTGTTKPVPGKSAYKS
ncbi:MULTISPECIES: hypothetical protein [unclassified Bradyrhizobium]|uniref:hypothetical protein n=1 Tax=unclassified Bradyrhizobium TaxID=2631580 RepID=UPI0028E2178E|nr:MULTISPECIES: hypothetical protein [unclassified Bradyrhizobium]